MGMYKKPDDCVVLLANSPLLPLERALSQVFLYVLISNLFVGQDTTLNKRKFVVEFAAGIHKGITRG